MTASTTLRPGHRVGVPWGFAEPRAATVLEVWGDPAAPSHVRVQLDLLDGEEELTVLLLDPNWLIDVA